MDILIILNSGTLEQWEQKVPCYKLILSFFYYNSIINLIGTWNKYKYI